MSSFVPTILIIKDRDNAKGQYVFDLIANSWEKRGFNVLESSDVGRLPKADVAVLHIDATRVPDRHRHRAGYRQTDANSGGKSK